MRLGMILDSAIDVASGPDVPKKLHLHLLDESVRINEQTVKITQIQQIISAIAAEALTAIGGLLTFVSLNRNGSLIVNCVLAAATISRLGRSLNKYLESRNCVEEHVTIRREILVRTIADLSQMQADNLCLRSAFQDSKARYEDLP